MPTLQKICVFGAGAIGGHIAAWLARGGLDVSVVARGAHLAAMQARGLRYVSDTEDFTVKLRASADTAELGPQDLVIATVKAHSLPDSVAAMQPLLGAETPVVFAINGIPWWYFHGLPLHAERRLPRLDPAGALWQTLGVQRAIGCVIQSPNVVIEPGVVRNNFTANVFTFGEPDDTPSPRLAQIVARLGAALPGVRASTNIRSDIWAKLLLNLGSSPLSALTQSVAADFLLHDDMAELFGRLVQEGVAVAASLGEHLEADVPARIKRLTRSRHPPSMLQDLVAGRPLEIDGQLRAVQDLARLGGVPTPTLDTVVALLGQRARTPPT
jgi:2-dehydropantoate 2-reductase